MMRLPDSVDSRQFAEDLDKHVAFVVNRFKESNQSPPYWGENPFEALEKAQLYLGKTLDAVFAYHNSNLHRRILPWVYRSYQTHGFRDDFFQTAIGFWMESVRFHYGTKNSVLPYLLDLLSLDAEMMEKNKDIPPSYILNDDYQLQSLLICLIEGDDVKASRYLDDLKKRNEGEFISQVIRPIMYEVGRYWELDRITVADEHQVTAFLSNYLAGTQVQTEPKKERKILITPAPNEFHELGAFLLAGKFKEAGWKVYYLNAGASKKEVLDYIGEKQPHIVAISVALILHAVLLKDMVEAIQKVYPQTPVLLGGKFISDNPEILSELNCRGGINEPQKIIGLAESLLDE